MMDLIVLGLVVWAGVATALAIRYHAQASASTTASATTLAGIANSLKAEMEILSGDVRGKIDSKFQALASWLVAELQKSLPAPAPGEAAPAPAPAAAPPDAPEVVVQKMEASYAAMGERLPKLKAALAAKHAADDALAKELAA